LFVVNPPGARIGTTVEVSVSGTDIEGPQALWFSNPAIRSELVPPPAPAKPGAKPVPAPAGPRFRVTIPPGTPVGLHDVRLVNAWGVSNPRAFAVGDQSEVMEKEPNDEVEQAQRVLVNTTVNGTISVPTDVDYYVFGGKKRQRVVVSCLTSSIDSRMHAALELYDAAGRHLASNHHYQGGDALLECKVPEDGDYFVRVFELTYTRGGPEYFYRLTLSTAPWIDAVFPPMAAPGKPAAMTVYGRNLPGGIPDPHAVIDGAVLDKLSVTVDIPGDPIARQRLVSNGHVPPEMSGVDGFAYRLRNSNGWSNPVLITYASAPVVLEREPNDRISAAQRVSVPCEIAGHLQGKRDRDWYVFSAKKGDVYAIDLLGQRLGASADLYFSVRSATPKRQLAELDDDAETLAPVKFFTRTDDPPAFRFAVPADGDYYVLVSSRDADFKAGPRQFYRLRIVPEQPDFRLIVTPASDTRPDACRLPSGGEQLFTVLAWRRDGYSGSITLSADGLPSGVTCPLQMMAPGQKQAPLVLSAAPNTGAGVWQFRVKGTGLVNGEPVEREARPAGITWPVQPAQNLPAVSRLDQSLVAAVRPHAPYRLVASVDRPVIGQGDAATLSLNLARLSPDFTGPLQVVPADLSPEISVNNGQPIVLAPGHDGAILPLVTRPTILPGLYSLAFHSTAQMAFSKDSAAKQKLMITVALPSTPALIEVVPRQVAMIAVAPSSVTIGPGRPAEVWVSVKRLYDFSGPFHVQLASPGTEVIPEQAVIPSGKNDTRLLIRLNSPAAPGQKVDLVVRVMALLHGSVPTAQEAHVSVQVIK
jgi:hypothetical protein